MTGAGMAPVIDKRALPWKITDRQQVYGTSWQIFLECGHSFTSMAVPDRTEAHCYRCLHQVKMERKALENGARDMAALNPAI